MACGVASAAAEPAPGRAAATDGFRDRNPVGLDTVRSVEGTLAATAAAQQVGLLIELLEIGAAENCTPQLYSQEDFLIP